jgi:MarR family transcriptional regulator for hemolysin
MKRKPKKPKVEVPPCAAKIHPHLTTYIGYCLHKVALKMRASLDARVSEYGLVSPQYGMLIILDIEGSITQMELGQYMAMDKATMVRMIDGLEELGFVKRSQSDTDRRAKHLELTAAGRKMVSALQKVRGEAEKEFLKPISAEERSQLHGIVLKLMR